jgi:hypothetical protein
MHLMELLAYMCHVESCFGPFRDSVSVGERYEHGMRRIYDMLRNYFGRTQWYCLVARLKWNLFR